MSLFKQLATGVATMVLAASAQAGLIINSIDLIMVDSTYNSLPLVGTDEDTALEALIDGIVTPAENPDNIICDISLDALEGITARGTCGADDRNDIGSLYFITGTATGAAELEFGMDWGRGGFAAVSREGLGLESLIRLDEDIWWRNNWSNSDVFGLSITGPGDFQISLMGFEGCCDGNNSARWRATDGEWQVLAVNAVPVPGALSLLALGLCGLSLFRRRPA